GVRKGSSTITGCRHTRFPAAAIVFTRALTAEKQPAINEHERIIRPVELVPEGPELWHRLQFTPAIPMVGGSGDVCVGIEHFETVTGVRIEPPLEYAENHQ